MSLELSGTAHAPQEQSLGKRDSVGEFASKCIVPKLLKLIYGLVSPNGKLQREKKDFTF